MTCQKTKKQLFLRKVLWIDMDYISYGKIAESLDEYAFTEKEYRLLQKMDWVIMEKIHGANFCVLFEGETIQYAKRKEILTEEDDFFGYQEALAGKLLRLRSLVGTLREDNPDIQTVFIYGELFGGGYPHTDVPILPTALIQTGVYYSPKVEFCIFDIAYTDADKSLAYLPHLLMEKLCQAQKLNYSHALWVGKWKDAWQYPIQFESTLPALLGYPNLPTNLAEGIIIKPLQNDFIQTTKGILRPIFKRKIAYFEETQYQQATGEQDTFLQILRLIWAMLTPNRLQNAISKIGRVGKKDLQKKAQIYQLIEADIQAKLIQKHYKIWQKTPQKQRTALWTQARQGFEKLWETEIL